MEQLDLNQSFATLSAASSGSNTVDLPNVNCSGLRLVIDITAISGATLTVTIKGKDQLSGKYYTILASAGKTGTGTTVLTVYPTITASANVIAQDCLPSTYQILWTVTGGTVTATLGGCLLI
jgi:hypothetical protein